ncbi:NUDIX hydrolase [Streptomyces sp. NPDC059698]|uniref:nucleotide triphosphate diphosphatase NUDT15 n=1 Tax=unclassified Streptomyces TaxID=2593676 RepID=UPI0009A0FBA0|nr:NUDIX domain-containing protein [Streptomyces sp. CB02366]WSS58838.1 NUDIX domain-containing protein [Streptomyces sp. NBC_01178]
MPADPAVEPTRNTRPPAAQASLGVGVIVEDGRHRVLLGRHRSGTWELPGGKVDATHESVAAAAVRELREETGLVVDEASVDVIAMVHDVIGGINRISMAAVVRLVSGAAEVTEPHLISAWHWIAPEELPTPLFDPSAQILAAWRPDLGIAHPPAHVLRIAPSTSRSRRAAPALAPPYGCGQNGRTV